MTFYILTTIGIVLTCTLLTYVVSYCRTKYYNEYKKEKDFKLGYDYAVSEYLKGLDTDELQRQIDESAFFCPTIFDKGASQAVSDIQDREKEQLLRFKYEMHEKLRHRVDMFNSIYLALHYDPTNPENRLEDAMFSGRHLVNELESLELIEDSYHRIIEEKGYSHGLD